MSLEENTVLFNVIEAEWSPEFSTSYFFALKFGNKPWGADEITYESLDTIAEKIVEKIAGTKSYRIISDPTTSEIDTRYFKIGEGLSGYSESPHVTNIRKLDREEMSGLGKKLSLKIQKKKKSS
ncbi:MAG: hypothetical protein AABX99_04335 [Nanoarchaeota archaeon]